MSICFKEGEWILRPRHWFRVQKIWVQFWAFSGTFCKSFNLSVAQFSHLSAADSTSLLHTGAVCITYDRGKGHVLI